MKAGLIEKIKALAERRKFEDLTMSPILTWTNEQLSANIAKLLKIPGAKVLFGGKPVGGTKIPKCFGAFECTAVYVPLKEMVKDDETFKLVTGEVFGPV